MGSLGSLTASRYPLPLLHLPTSWISAFEGWSAPMEAKLCTLRPAKEHVFAQPGPSLRWGSSPPYPA